MSATEEDRQALHRAWLAIKDGSFVAGSEIIADHREASIASMVENIKEALDRLDGTEDLRPKPPLTDHELDSGHDWESDSDELETNLTEVRAILQSAIDSTEPKP